MHTPLRRQRQIGFTVVELIITVVVIGILASIVIVSYQGTRDKGNTSSAKTAATTVIRKVEVYSSERGAFPATSSLLTASTESERNYYISGIVFAASMLSAKPATPNTVTFQKCGSINTPVTGAKVFYWDYAAKAVTTTPLTTGTISGGAGNDTVTCTVGP